MTGLKTTNLNSKLNTEKTQTVEVKYIIMVTSTDWNNIHHLHWQSSTWKTQIKAQNRDWKLSTAIISTFELKLPLSTWYIIILQTSMRLTETPAKVKTQNSTQPLLLSINYPYQHGVMSEHNFFTSLRLQTPAKVKTQNSTQSLLLSTNYPYQHDVMFVHHCNAHFYPFPFMFKPL